MTHKRTILIADNDYYFVQDLPFGLKDCFSAQGQSVHFLGGYHKRIWRRQHNSWRLNRRALDPDPPVAPILLLTCRTEALYPCIG